MFAVKYSDSRKPRPFLDPRRLNSNGVNFACAGAGALPETNRGLVILFLISEILY